MNDNKAGEAIYVREKPMARETWSNWAWSGIAFFSDVVLAQACAHTSSKSQHLRHIGDIFAFLRNANTAVTIYKAGKMVVNFILQDLLYASTIEGGIADVA